MAREYSPEVKAQVLAALLAGQSASSIAKQFDIPRGTVAAWQARKTDPVVATVAANAAQKKQAEIQELILDLLIAQLRSQIAMADHLADKDWLMQQDAAALGAALGISNDKVFRLLQALDNDRSESQPSQA